MRRSVLFILFFFSSPIWTQDSFFIPVDISDKTDSEKYFSLSDWKKRIDFQEKNQRPWIYALRHLFPREVVGKFLACYGHCFFRHQTGQYRGLPLFTIKEGDELFTDSQSYLWIFLLDGTLVRLSPDSSISFQEIAIGTKEFLFYARINQGNILWLPRYRQTYQSVEVRETDTLFLPMKHLPSKYTSQLEIHKNLNKKIKENNTFVRNKPTYSFLTTSTGAFYGKNLYGEFIVFPKGSSLFKLRLPTKELSKQEESTEVTFYSYGLTSQGIFNPERGKWYQTDPQGGEPNAYPYGQQLALGEYTTRHISSILLAREILLKRYSPFAFYLLRHKTLAERFGYYRWGSLKKEEDLPESDLSKRLTFLKTYTKALETDRLYMFQKHLWPSQTPPSLPPPIMINKKFYQRAINDYFLGKNSDILKKDLKK